MATYNVENFGCRATQADGAALDRQFEQRGLARAPASQADIVILNTCTVTAAADQDARAAIRRVQRQNPNAKIVVTGCYAQRAPQEVAALPGVTCVVGNSHKHQLADLTLPNLVKPQASKSNREVEVPGWNEKDWDGHDFSLEPALSERSESKEPALSERSESKQPALSERSESKQPALSERSESKGAIRSVNSWAAPQSSTFVPLTALSEYQQGAERSRVGSRQPEAEGRLTESRLFVSDIFAHTEFLAAPVFELANPNAPASPAHARTRPNLKVQDGCDNRCSFCVIPYVRGQSRSLPLLQVLSEVNALIAAGYREVVISGINLGRWGRDLAVSHPPPDLGNIDFRLPLSGFRPSEYAVPSRTLSLDQDAHTPNLKPSPKSEVRGASSEVRRPRSDARSLPEAGRRKPVFEDLIRAILDHTSLEKLRISSVEPMDWSDDLIRLVAESPRIAKHAHVPLQSGSDAVLRRMHRKYRPWHYREKIEKIRAALPTAAIGADVMVGFPGETDAEFEATRRLIEDLPFTYLHVFTYSARPGTPAADMPNQVPVHIARERNRILRSLAEEKKRSFMRTFIGHKVEAITLSSCGAGAPARESGSAAHSAPGRPFTEALTDNYLKLHLNEQHHPNRWISAEVKAVVSDALVGHAI